MPTQGLAQLIIIGLVILLCLIALFLFKQYTKSSIALFCLSLFLIVNTFYCKSGLVKSGERIRAGSFKLDYRNSYFGNPNSLIDTNATLVVRQNNTFEIKGGIPLKTKQGIWKYFDDGDIYYVEYKFQNEHNSYQMQDNGIDSWTFESNGFTKPDSTYLLKFKRE
jgi:hypothetical protein